MTGIFINYRTGDDAYAAALVDQRLRVEFGDENVFRDSRSMRPATDFPPELWRRLNGSSVVIVVIGPQWLTLKDKDDNRRLDDPADYVRREIATAFEAQIPVLPVLLDGARMPSVADLPADIQRVRTQQYLHLRLRYVDQDLARLVEALRQIMPTRGDTAHMGGDASVGPPSQSEVKIIGESVNISGPIAGRDVHRA